MRTVATRPSHLPTTYSSRMIGRASIASVVPDSTSAEIAGAAANTAENASTKLNMNITRMSSCDATAARHVGDRARLSLTEARDAREAPGRERDHHDREQQQHEEQPAAQ